MSLTVFKPSFITSAPRATSLGRDSTGQRKESPIDACDYLCKTGESNLGGNSGDVYLACVSNQYRPSQYNVLIENGFPVKYYLKYQTETVDHIWNEILADRIYRILNVDVPETRITTIENISARASRWVYGHHPTDSELGIRIRSGFIADCLLSNCDIPETKENSIVENSTDVFYRIDNGGSLLFRALGKRKGNYCGIVPELETIRDNYTNLSDHIIEEQIRVLNEELTAPIVYREVDSTSLSCIDREYLKQTIIERRKFITEYYEKSYDAPVGIPPIGMQVGDILESICINDDELIKIIPEWSRFIGGNGYLNNKLLLGTCIKQEIKSLISSSVYRSLPLQRKNILLIATFFKDFGKSTGTINEEIIESSKYKKRSTNIATRYLLSWGYSRANIRLINNLILNF